MKEPKEVMQILNIDHLGIVAGIIDEMEFNTARLRKMGSKTKRKVFAVYLRE